LIIQSYLRIALACDAGRCTDILKNSDSNYFIAESNNKPIVEGGRPLKSSFSHGCKKQMEKFQWFGGAHHRGLEEEQAGRFFFCCEKTMTLLNALLPSTPEAA
jgi:hypothetical protein